MELLKRLAPSLLAASLLLAGCTGTRPLPPTGTVAPPPPADSTTEIVGQTSRQAVSTPRRMPLDRRVHLLDGERAPVSGDLPSSAAFTRRILRDSSTSDIEHIDEKVDALLHKMTLPEKVGQMTQLTLAMVSTEKHENNPAKVRQQHLDQEKLRDVLIDHHVGSILNVTGQAFSLDHWHDLIGQIQRIATADTRLGIPVIYGIDAVHGANYTQEATLFPQNQGLAATWNPALAQEAAVITARDVRASGIAWNFAPVLGLGREPRWPRFYEALSEDVYLTTTMGVALVHGYQGTDVHQPDRVAATLKHYVGYSVPQTGLDRTPALIPEVALREQYLKPFAAAIDAGAKSIMVNSGEVNGTPVHASSYLLQDVLRGELGFKGVVVSDWADIKKLVNVHHVAANERAATKMAVMAGVDMSMVPDDLSFYDHLLALVRDGEVPRSRIDEAVRRILKLKFEVGLFDDPLLGMDRAEAVGSERARRVALQAARESITLLRNRDAGGGEPLLPLDENQDVLVTGPAAHSMQSLSNGWTYTWQGGGAAQAMFPAGRPTLMEAIRAKVGAASDGGHMTYVPGATLTAPDHVQEAVSAAREADVAVVALGEGAYAETPGDIRQLELPEAQRQLLKRVGATGTPVVLVLAEGRPRILGKAEASADAVLAAYNPGLEGGQAIMEVLYGKVNPSGHLPFTYPRSSVGTVTYDRKYSENQDTQGGMNGFDPLFAFGKGLSYTKFAYSDLTVSHATASTSDLQRGDDIAVQVTVENTGKRRGKEVVQLYLSDLVASITPPVRKLKRFAKVDLAPGERRRLTFRLRMDDFSFIGADGNSVVEPGAFRLQVQDLRETLRLKGQPVFPETALAH